MNIQIFKNAAEAGKASGKLAAQYIREAITHQGSASVILATGTSQLETLNQLLKENIDWSNVTVFHLDEYIGLSIEHPASFRKYLKDRFINKAKNLAVVHLINGEAEAHEECERLGKLIADFSIDVALVGIGENGHLAFNDPPADFTTNNPYIVVALDEPCRKQQLGEGWFKNLYEVPTHAISMSVNQILKSNVIICTVPDQRKAIAVKNSLEHQVDPTYPATILQNHRNTFYFFDTKSASLLRLSALPHSIQNTKI